MLSRRNFVQGATALPVGLAFPGAFFGVSTDAFAQDALAAPLGIVSLENPPEALGCGVLSTSGESKARVVRPEVLSDMRRNPVSATRIEAQLADDRSSFARLVSWSAEAKLGFSGGSASARASASSQHRLSRRALTLVLNKFVLNEKIFLDDLYLRDEALDLLRTNPDLFAVRYGDRIVKSVTTGGLLTIIYNLNFRTSEERSAFQAGADVRFGGSGGSASYTERIRRTASRAELSLEAFVTGVRDAPTIFRFEGTDGRAGSRPANLDSSDQLFRFFDGFHTAVFQNPRPTPLFIEVVDAIQAINAPPDVPRLQDRRRVVDEGLRLDNLIDARLADCAYFSQVAFAWNPGVAESEVMQVRDRLAAKALANETATREIATLERRNLALPYAEMDIDSLPTHWTLRQIREIGMVRLRSSPSQRRYAESLAVPSFEPGQPAKVILRVRMRVRGFAETTLAWWLEVLDSNGALVPDGTLHQERASQNIATGTSILWRDGDDHIRPFEKIFVLPASAARIRFRVEKSQQLEFTGGSLALSM